MVDDPDLDAFMHSEVETDDGRAVGTIVDVDRDAREFYFEPSEELDVNTWEAVGWHTADEYDANWEDLDYDLWREGDANLTVDYEEWPFTLPADRVENVGGDPAEDGDELRLSG